MEKFRVIVGNIGTVYAGGIQRIAEQTYDEYVSQSKANYGRAAGEGVIFLQYGKIKHEYIGHCGESDSRIE